MRLAETLSILFGRVEILARGLDAERRAAELALSKGQSLQARDSARAILAEVPESPLALALWADAAEDAWLDHEVVTALSALVQQVPWRADVWLRLGRAGRRVEWPNAREALERAVAAGDQPEAVRQALYELCDMDLALGDAGRAQQWLDRAVVPTATPDPDLVLRRAECALARGDIETAATHAAALPEESPLDGRSALVKARALLHTGRIAEAADKLVRAFVLGAPGAADALMALVAASRDPELLDRVRRVADAAGQASTPAWTAAFAFAEGKEADARRALGEALAAGHTAAAPSLLRMALESRDVEALAAIAERAPGALPAGLMALHAALGHVGAGRDDDALDQLDVVSIEATAWANDVRRDLLRAWVPPPGGAPARWDPVLRELRRAARAVDRVDLVGAAEALAVERERPLRVAVVGEFNAGKSTFLNALLGHDVAPTGVLPTTATLHWVAWAPEAFARIVVRGGQDRVVPHADLKAALRRCRDDGAEVARVFIYAPIERLKRVEILDTPGFNAPDPDHVAAARQGFEEAHVAIWLLDANQPIKQSEHLVLAEIRDLGVPVQILANKADRLGPAEIERVLGHIREGLATAGLASHVEPIAFSARRALAGRLGDASALEASNWAAVESLLAEHIVDRSDELKERALRRKAARIAGEIAALVARRAEDERAAARERRERTEAQRTAAGRLRLERARIAQEMDRAIEPARRLLESDLRPLTALREGAQAGPTPSAVRAYAEERFVARVAPAFSTEIARACALELPASASSLVRAVLAGAAAAHAAPASLATASFTDVAGAALDAVAALLAQEASKPEPADPWSAIGTRIDALRAALGPAAS